MSGRSDGAPDAMLADIFNYREVDEHVSTSGQPSEAELEAVARAGFEVVVNLGLHGDPNYSLADEAGTVGALNMAYVHIPIRFDAPTEDDLRAFFDAMASLAGKRVWLHCAANKRVTAFLGLYRVIRLGWSEADAFALMHDVWEPDAIWSRFISSVLGGGLAER